MRRRNDLIRDRFEAVLSRNPRSNAAGLASELGVSIPTVHRLVRELGDKILIGGRAGRTRYAMRRALRGDVADVPLYELNAEGNAELVAELALVRLEGSLMALPEQGDFPIPDEARDGWWEGLPYPLYDMRPQGYMGRQLANAEADRFQVSRDPAEWSDDDIVLMLSHLGADTSGNLILGNLAYERWLNIKRAPPVSLRESETGAAYVSYAEQAVAAGIPGSSAAGEFPKFLAVRELGGCKTPHVLVKFSGVEDSAAVRRWSDLLLCEHHALESALPLPGIQSARSRIIQASGRTFLELERFDRIGLFGRTPLISLESINGAFLGMGTSDWTALGAKMVSAELLDESLLPTIQQLWWYGKLIANSDMHLGNLSFLARGAFELAPLYDMLPMLYAPLPGGEVPLRQYDPALPRPPQRVVWKAAARAAERFWQRAADDARISPPFRSICAANARRLKETAALA